MGRFNRPGAVAVQGRRSKALYTQTSGAPGKATEHCVKLFFFFRDPVHLLAFGYLVHLGQSLAFLQLRGPPGTSHI